MSSRTLWIIGGGCMIAVLAAAGFVHGGRTTDDARAIQAACLAASPGWTVNGDTSVNGGDAPTAVFVADVTNGRRAATLTCHAAQHTEWVAVSVDVR